MIKQHITILFLICFGLSACNLKDLKKVTDKFNKENIDKVKAVTGTFTEKDEIQMGGVIISSLLGAAPLVNDPVLQRYVNNVGYWVAQQSERPQLPWTFGVLDNENVNAFAAPGGYILVTKGLLRYLQNEAELASVLGHEIIHVELKHHLDILKKSSRVNLAANWGAKQLDSKAVDKLVNAGVQIYSRGLDKEAEFEADLKGVSLAAKAGYDPYAMLDLLTTLESINAKDSKLALLTKTHPPFSSRIERLDRSIDTLLQGQGNGRQLTQRFLQMKQRL